jgi:hypothetical protein
MTVVVSLARAFTPRADVSTSVGALCSVLSSARIRKIGVRVPRSTDSATDPAISRPIPLRPWVLIMIKSGFAVRAASRIAGAAAPYQTDAFTLEPPSVRSRAATVSR